MNTTNDLMKALRSGRLGDVIAALDAGAPIELDDGQGNAGLPLAMACLLGHAEIVRELILRGAKVNTPDNRKPTSPLAMAVRGGKTEVVKVLIELGVVVPSGMYTGLNEHELMLARWKAEHFFSRSAADGCTPDEMIIEEIEVLGCYGTDTNVLNAEMGGAVEHKANKK